MDYFGSELGNDLVAIPRTRSGVEVSEDRGENTLSNNIRSQGYNFPWRIDRILLWNASFYIKIQFNVYDTIISPATTWIKILLSSVKRLFGRRNKWCIDKMAFPSQVSINV